MLIKSPLKKWLICCPAVTINRLHFSIPFLLSLLQNFLPAWNIVHCFIQRRDRSRSPQRDSSRGHRNRNDSYSQEEAYSSRGRGYNRGRQDERYSNNQRGAQQGKWPDNNQQQYDDSYGYHEPSATLKVSNVPEWLTSERVSSCQKIRTQNWPNF